MQISRRTFLVTGGSSGLGAACVRRLTIRGAKVVIGDLNREAGEALAREIGSAARFVETDVTDEASVQRAVNVAADELGDFVGAVNCAGIITGTRVLGREGPHDLGLFARVVQVNLVGTFNVIRLAAAALQRNEPNADGERGVLICTASVAAFEGQIGQAAYSASKAGVVGMVLPIARELAKFGIRVMAIAPGIFDTPMMAGMSEELRASLGQQVPFPPRLGRPEEFAALVGSIVENAMLNGEVIRLDGAIRMGVK